MAKKRSRNFKSVKAYKNWVKAAHSIPSKKKGAKGRSVAQMAPGRTSVKVRGKSFNKRIKH
jgi:hypothetical protein